MRSHPRTLLVILGAFLAGSALATTHYVDLNSTNPVAPFTDWNTAATNIQDAVDVATNGDLVLVTNGIYNSGGTLAGNDPTPNRVAITQAVAVQSVNGPWVTEIQGPGAVVETSAVRCAWLTNNASLTGFTLKWGGTALGQSGGGVWCASTNATVADCVIVSNTGSQAGGAYRGTLRNCLISSNTGGVISAYAINCTIVSNGGFGFDSTAAEGGATNCIIYYNGNFVGEGSYSYCCLPQNVPGTGNFEGPPGLFVDGIHLGTGSPCVGAGTIVATGVDIFGEAWATPPSVGCAEWQPAPDPVIVRIQASNASPGFSIQGVANGEPPFTYWWLKGGALLQDNGHFSATQSNVLLASGISVNDAGGYQFVASNGFGVITSLVATLAVHCVDASATNSVPPFASWSDAATNIQDAIDAAAAGDVILVTNGEYSGGGISVDGTLTNRVSLTKPITVESINGAWVTAILGAGPTNGPAAVRCAWLTNNAALIGFTLKWGATAASGLSLTSMEGGGVWCASSNATVADCVIVTNVSARTGGGVYEGTVLNCLISSNSSGTYGSIDNNCTIVSNAGYGFLVAGGESTLGTATNCIIVGNGDFEPGNSDYSYSCIARSEPGPGNITKAPLLFVDGVHLGIGSPCIGAGTNVATGLDIFGRPWANPPSMGCAEWQPAPLVTAPQLQLTGTPIGFSIGNADVDGQGPFTFSWLENGMILQSNANFILTDTNGLVATGVSLGDAGSYQLVVSNAYGVVTSAVVSLTLHCVDANGTNPVAPYLDWATAATNIQDAIEAAAAGDIVVVTNGVYATGGESMDGALTNRVTLDKALTVMSVNGYSATTIQGAWDPATTNGALSVRCAWLTNGAALAGFTLCNGSTLANGNASSGQGAGAWCSSSNAIVANCVLSNNIAVDGGGFAFGTINNSLLVNNFAVSGGAAYNATLNNCTAQANFTTTLNALGAGTFNCNARNSIVVGNFDGYPLEAGPDDFAPVSGNSYSYNNSCTEAPPPGFTKMPPGASNINAGAVNPQLLDWYHIAATSPCRGAGSDLYASGTDLDGEPWANPPSIGCDEVVLSNRVGALSVSILPVDTNVLVNTFQAYFGAVIGRATAVSWDFSNGTVITNVGETVGYAWTNAGNQIVTFTAYNETYPDGVSTNITVLVSPPAQPLLQSAIVTNDSITFTFQGQFMASYVVQFTTNLTPPVVWQTLRTISSSGSGPNVISNAIGTNTAGFYRVLAQ